MIDLNQTPSRLKAQRTTIMAHPRFHFRLPLSLFLMLIQALPESILTILKNVKKAIGNVPCQMRMTLEMSLHRSGGSLRYPNRLNRIDNIHFHRHRFSVLPHAKNLLGCFWQKKLLAPFLELSYFAVNLFCYSNRTRLYQCSS